MTQVCWIRSLSLGLVLAAPAWTQTVTGRPRDLAARTPLTLQVGVPTLAQVVARDTLGRVLPATAIRLTGPRQLVAIRGLEVTALTAGRFEIFATTITGDSSVAPLTVSIPVIATWPPLARVEIEAEAGRLTVGSSLAHRTRGVETNGKVRPGTAARWRSSNPAIATVDAFGNVTGVSEGTVTITATIDSVSAAIQHAVVANPVVRLELALPREAVRTGDVVSLTATARDRAGRVVDQAPIAWSLAYVPDDSIRAAGAAGDVRNGKFVAEFAGQYVLTATSGHVAARQVIDVRPRDAVRRITVTGRGSITNVHVTDLWPWTGADGRDYCLVGTFQGDGIAYVYDITDPARLVKTDSIKVDARAINDVMVSPDGRYGVISREGASDRVNGVVILDLAVSAHPRIIATFSDQLTGGVHNVFATNDYLYAISNLDKYLIIDMKDPAHPRRVGEYNHPESRVHDLWVHDGIAYSSEWGVGLVIVDVGNGKYGGTPQRPVLVNTVATTSGQTHEVFPYFQKSTGKVYAFLGDEIMSREGRPWAGTNYVVTATEAPRGDVAQTAAGYTHIIDITDPLKPVNVARYEQPEYGSHDIIVENDVMYQAYYEGGVRVVDVSGELMGNLARQGREIAVYKPFDPQGFTANAPFVMNAMPWKGRILFTDFNSGLWSARLEPRTVVP
jgi:hypothetical protein